MSEPARGVIVAHADLAAALLRAVERIAGVSDRLVAVSNEGAGPDEVRRAVEEAAGAGPAVLFTDLASGSCAAASRLAAGRSRRVAVVTGTNLPMLLDFVFHRDMEPAALAERLVEKGRAGICTGSVSSTDSNPAGADRPVSS